jgi:hypothetical protein
MDVLLHWLSTRNPVDTFAVAVIVVFWFWIWRTSHEGGNSFDIVDLISDPYTGKAAAAALVYIFLAGVSVWWVVRSAVGGGDPSNFLLAVLGVFIAKGAADRAISAWGSNQPPPAAGNPPPIQQAPDVSIQVGAPAQIKTETTVTRGKQ